MRRREFISLLGGTAVAWPIAARGQQPRPRIAVLSLYSAQDEGQLLRRFVEGLGAIGYVAGRNMDIDYRHVAGDTDRLGLLAQELVDLRPDVALVTSVRPVIAVKRLAPNLPVVCPQLNTEVVPSLAASYSRPGGSVTGIAASVEDLQAKLLELALDAVPGSVRIGLLANPEGAATTFNRQKVETAAGARGVVLLTQEARTAGDLARAFDAFAKQKVDVVIIPPNGLFTTYGTGIAQLALAAHLPTIFAHGLNVEAGGLASYGVDVRENYRRAADYVDKILKGAKPGDLPIEFPTKLMLTINLKTAKALGLAIPPTLLARADEVIE